MKKTWKIMFPLAIASAFVFTACGSEEEPTKTTTTDVSCNGGTLTISNGEKLYDATYNGENVVIPADAIVELVGAVKIPANCSITIGAGATVKANTQVFSYLLVKQGAKINATGTVAKPIVFTSGAASRSPSDWGGVVIHGKAPVNNTAGKTTATDTEIYTGPYGGDTNADNSGTLKYVRIEFAGYAINSGKEFNGLFLAGVGSGTTINHVQVHRGADDGIEIFGGAVDMANILITNNQDDGFDIDEGWTGTATHIAVAVPSDGEQGIEYDGLGADANRATNTVFTNFTLVAADTKAIEGIISVRKKGGIRLYNSYIANASSDFGTIAVNKDGADTSMLYKFSSNVVESMFTTSAETTAITGEDALFCGKDEPSLCTASTAAATVWSNAYANNVYTDIGTNIEAPDTVFTDLTLLKVAKTATYTDPEAGPNGTDLPVATYVGAFSSATDTWADTWTTFVTN